MRKILTAHPSANPIITARNPLGGGEQGNFPIQATLMGPDITKLNAYALQLLAKGQHVPSLADSKTSVTNSMPEIRVAVDRGRAADLGVRMSTVGSTLRLMVSGDDEISTYREGSEQYPVKMRVLESQRRDVETIGRRLAAMEHVRVLWPTRLRDPLMT